MFTKSSFIVQQSAMINCRRNQSAPVILTEDSSLKLLWEDRESENRNSLEANEVVCKWLEFAN